MKKMLKLISLSVSVLTLLMINTYKVEAATVNGKYFKNIDEAVLADGDVIQLENLNITGSGYLKWSMGRDYKPHLTLDEGLSMWHYENEFYVDKYDDQHYGLYVISSYDNFKYYISSDFSASEPTLRREGEVKEENRRFALIKNGESYQLRFGNNNIPISMYLTGETKTSTIALESYGSASMNKGLNWSIKKSVPIDITYEKTSSWGDEFAATITITNNTGVDIKDWSLQCFYKYDINKNTVSNAKLENRNGYSTVFSNDGWNSLIPNGQSISFNFTGIGDGNNAPRGVVVNDNSK